jgi:hypothetical protein
MQRTESDVHGKGHHHTAKHGVIICLPKPSDAQTPTDYRPIILLNTDYKLLPRIIAHRLRPVMREHIRKNKLCGVPGNTIFEAVATGREAIAQTEITHTPLCVFSLNFREAFDRDPTNV